MSTAPLPISAEIEPSLPNWDAGMACLTGFLTDVMLEQMPTAKHDVEQLLNRLPDDASVEDIQYHLYVLDKVRRGLEDARVNGAIPQEEVESRLNKWLTE
ncbi:MAG TPA: hypothetical protein VGL74_13930 [Terriglobales bacterium]|jgi:hypothetical protein